MKMHFLSGGRLKMRKSTYYADAARGEMFELPVACTLLRHSQGNVLFDTGCHPGVAEDPESRLGTLAKYMNPIMAVGDHVLTSLGTVGLGPDDIDVVVCSHLHTDHCGCNQFFRKATIIVHARELVAAREPGAFDSGYIAADWDNPIPMKTIDSQMDVFGDGKIVLVPLPGHSPGTTGALVGLDDSGAFLLTADALSVRANLDQGTVPKNTWNAEAFLNSLDEIRKLEAAGVTIICGHDDAQWNRLRKGPQAYT
jgi:glyoxylase-like metal-dependent hydrolase (beta-lactamase superfamily II)